MNDEQRQHLETLLHTYQRRMRYLEQQIATFGPRTPPEIHIEHADVAAALASVAAELNADPSRHAALKQRWFAALTAFYEQRWADAEAMLAEVHALHPGYEDVEARLAEAGRQRKLGEFYAYLRAMRANDAWPVVLNALADFDLQGITLPDPDGLRQWAERRRRREQDTKLCPACGEINPASFALCLRCGRRIV